MNATILQADNAPYKTVYEKTRGTNNGVTFQKAFDDNSSRVAYTLWQTFYGRRFIASYGSTIFN